MQLKLSLLRAHNFINSFSYPQISNLKLQYPIRWKQKQVYLLFFIFNLLNDAVCGSYHDWWIGKDLQGSSRGLDNATFLHCPYATEGKHENNQIIGILGGIR